MRFRSVLVSMITGVLAIVFAYQCVYRDIEKLRFKLLESPMEPERNGQVAFRFLNPRPYDARIIAARINNNTDRSKTFTIQLNETVISSQPIKPNSFDTQL